MHVNLEINHTSTGQVDGHLYRDGASSAPQRYCGWLELIALLEAPDQAVPTDNQETNIAGAPPPPLP